MVGVANWKLILAVPSALKCLNIPPISMLDLVTVKVWRRVELSCQLEKGLNKVGGAILVPFCLIHKICDSHLKSFYDPERHYIHQLKDFGSIWIYVVNQKGQPV